MVRVYRSSSGDQIVIGASKAASRFRVSAVQTDFEFGALTKAGEGGVTVSGTSITAGDPSGHWQIVGGLLSPTSTGVSAGFSGAPYSLTTNTGLTYTVSCPANVRHVNTLAEVNAAANDEANISGATVKIRGGSKGGILGGYGAFTSIASRATFTAADENDQPIFTGLLTAGVDNALVGNVTFSKLKFFRPQVETSHNYFQPIGSGGVIAVTGDAGTIVEDCEVYSDMGNTYDNSWLVEQFIGISIDCDGAIVRRNTVRNMAFGIWNRGANNLIEGNTIKEIQGDGISVRMPSSNLTIRGNYIYDFVGLGNILHSDGIQFTDPGSGSYDNVIIEGNVMFPGAVLTKTLMSPYQDGTAGSAVNIATSQTLTAADHAMKVVQPTSAGLTITLPPAADCPQETIWFNNGSTYPFTLVGVSGGDVSVSSSAYQGTYAVRSDGSAWTRYRVGVRAGVGTITSDYTCLSRQSACAFLVDASAGNITITLPSASGMGYLGFTRIDNTANTVTIQPSGSDTLIRRGGSVASLSLPIKKAFSVLGGTTQWTSFPGYYGLQCIFGNGTSNYVYNDMTIRGNILWAEGSHAIRIEQDFTFQKIYNNTVLKTYHPDRDADGVIDSFDGLTTVQNPALRMKGDAAATPANRFAANNFVAVNIDLADGTGTTAHGQDNVELDFTGSTSAANSVSTLNVYVQGDAIEDFYPLTPDQAIDAVLAKSGGALDGTYIGALGTTRSNGYWDFVAGQKNASAPEPTIT